MDSAAQHYSSQQASDQGTNFSADGSLTIQSSKNTFERSGKTKEPENDSEQLHRDLESRAEDVPVESEVYSQVPIGEFGAALLRGMGWKGSDDNNNNKSDDTMGMPRPHRLGLGATPKLPEPTAPGKMRRPDQVKRDERLKQQQQEYEARRQKQVRLDKQQTLQVGSIVFITDTKKRARMVQMMGVPGLNRVLVQYEGETSNTSVKKGDVVLVDREELSDRPFREAKEERMSSREPVKKEENGDRKRAKREEDGGRDRDRERDRDGRRRRREENDEYNRKNSDRDRDRNSSSSRRETKRQRTSASPAEDVQHSRWLIPNIRVRVVTKKLSSRQYKQKGIVLDVTHGGAYATLQMNDGQILDRVPERYLETALPKVGGNAIVLTGKHRLQKGKLLERSSDSGKGVIQVFEDMNVVKLSLDDMAEWCGPLDDDMEL
jgi:G patch domain/KOW motif-containing protein